MVYSLVVPPTVKQGGMFNLNSTFDPKPGARGITFYLFVDAKDGSNGHKAVNVGWSIKGIKTDHIFTLNKKENINTTLL